MKTKLTKILLATALMAGMGAASTTALATQVGMPFSITDPISSATFSNLGAITGNYVETITFTGLNTFEASILFQATGLVDQNALNVTGSTQDLNHGYNLYATLLTSGTFAPSGGGYAFFANPLSMSMYLDPYGVGTADTFGPGTADGTGGTAYTVTDPGSNDQLLVTGTGSGNGTETCTGNFNCGSFGLQTSFNLTAAGSSYFTYPVPFWGFEFTSGNFDGFTPAVAETVTLNGVANVTVPEPETLALFGIGLLAMAMAKRYRAQKQA
jgi:hypothetical protein